MVYVKVQGATEEHALTAFPPNAQWPGAQPVPGKRLWATPGFPCGSLWMLFQENQVSHGASSSLSC